VRHMRQEHLFPEVLYLVSMCKAIVVSSSGQDSCAHLHSVLIHRPEFTGKMSCLSSLV
jgi:hypothetical protein